MVEVDEKVITEDIDEMVNILVEIDKLQQGISKLQQKLAIKLADIIGETTK